MYCHNPMELDLFSRALIRDAARHLNEGGLLQMLFEWVGLEGQPWKDRLKEWIDG